MEEVRESKLEQVQEYIFRYIPFNKDFPIAIIDVTIVAKNRKEAELIALDHKHKFFDQDCICTVKEGLVGYRRKK
jgi:hypothetical protein